MNTEVTAKQGPHLPMTAYWALGKLLKLGARQILRKTSLNMGYFRPLYEACVEENLRHGRSLGKN